MKKEKEAKNKVNDIVNEIHENVKKANKLFLAALGGVKELTDILAKKANSEKAAAKEPPAAKKKSAKAKETKPAEPGPADNVPPTVRRRTPASVRLTPREVTLNIGSYPVRELAERDASDLLNNPKVFWYRPVRFPDPKRYGVQPSVERAQPVKRTDPKFDRSPWTVSVTISVTGDAKKAENWGFGVYTRNKGDQE